MSMTHLNAGAGQTCPQVTAVGEARPDGERITKAIITFPGEPVDPEGIVVKGRTIVERIVEHNVVTLILSESDPGAQVFPRGQHRNGPPGGPGMRGGSGGPGMGRGPAGPGGPEGSGMRGGAGGPGGSGGPGMRKGPFGMPARKLLPVAVTVTIPGYEGEITSTKVIEPVIEDFVQGSYKNLRYNLFTPKNKEPGKQYPLIMFIPDLSVNGDDPKMALAQGIGATVWAEPEEQAKHPCYVLAVQIPADVLLTNDDYIAAPELEDIKDLLDKVVAGNHVDRRRIYATGQSQGCMASCELNIRYPDYFAASMLISGHWDREKMIALSGKKFFFGLSSGGRGEFPCFNAITDGMEAKGVDVRRVHLNFREGWEVNNAKVARMLEGNPTVGYVIFDEETAFPDDGTGNFPGRHHSRGWELSYQLAPARDWLLEQHL